MTKFHFSNGINAAHYTVEIVDNSVTFHSGASVKFHGDVADIGRLIRAILVATAPDANIERLAASNASPDVTKDEKTEEPENPDLGLFASLIVELCESIVNDNISPQDICDALGEPDVIRAMRRAAQLIASRAVESGITPMSFMLSIAKSFGL